MSLPFDQGVSTFWSASDTDFKNLSLGVSAFDQGVSGFWLGCLHLLIRVSSKTWLWFHLHPPFHQDVSAFWSTSDTDFKNLSPNFDQCGSGCLHLSASDTDFKNLSLGVSAFWSGCLCLLIRMSLPFDQQVTLTSKTLSKFHQGGQGLSPPFDQQMTLDFKGVVSAFCCLLPFDQQVTLTSKT